MQKPYAYQGSRLSAPELKRFLDEKLEHYNTSGFIADDPIRIPHRFTKRQDIEIAGFFAAILAWGQRKTILAKSNELMVRMGDEPHHFVCTHSENDLRGLLSFRHRTFNATDLLYVIEFFSKYYQQHDSLEQAFTVHPGEANIAQALIRFKRSFFSLADAPQRTRKHVPSPEQKSACKRLNMFLRWMVRRDGAGVDFGLWKSISPSQLICPLDLHVHRVATEIKLLRRKQADWQAAVELTAELRSFDPLDPVKYDYALFGLGVNRKASMFD